MSIPNSARKKAPFPARRRYCSISDAADYLGVTERTVRQMIADGRLVGYRMGNRFIRVDLDEIDAAMQPFGPVTPSRRWPEAACCFRSISATLTGSATTWKVTALPRPITSRSSRIVHSLRLQVRGRRVETDVTFDDFDKALQVMWDHGIDGDTARYLGVVGSLVGASDLMSLPLREERPWERHWGNELDELWPAITENAQLLLAGETVTHQQVEAATQRVWEDTE